MNTQRVLSGICKLFLNGSTQRIVMNISLHESVDGQESFKVNLLRRILITKGRHKFIKFFVEGHPFDDLQIESISESLKTKVQFDKPFKVVCLINKSEESIPATATLSVA